MKKTGKQRLSLKKEHLRVLTTMDRDRVRGGFISCSYPTYDDCCGSASTATSLACGGE
jgi:hypothetical protein